MLNDLSGLSVPAVQPAAGAQLEVKPATLLALGCDFVGTRPSSLETNELLYFFFLPLLAKPPDLWVSVPRPKTELRPQLYKYQILTTRPPRNSRVTLFIIYVLMGIINLQRTCIIWKLSIFLFENQRISVWKGASL